LRRLGRDVGKARGDRLEGLAQHGQKLAAMLGEFDLACPPYEERQRELLFEQFDMPADGALAHMELRCGSGKALVTRRRFEGAQGIERRQSDHCLSLSFP